MAKVVVKLQAFFYRSQFIALVMYAQKKTLEFPIYFLMYCTNSVVVCVWTQLRSDYHRGCAILTFIVCARSQLCSFRIWLSVEGTHS